MFYISCSSFRCLYILVVLAAGLPPLELKVVGDIHVGVRTALVQHLMPSQDR